MRHEHLPGADLPGGKSAARQCPADQRAHRDFQVDFSIKNDKTAFFLFQLRLSRHSDECGNCVEVPNVLFVRGVHQQADHSPAVYSADPYCLLSVVFILNCKFQKQLLDWLLCVHWLWLQKRRKAKPVFQGVFVAFPL